MPSPSGEAASGSHPAGLIQQCFEVHRVVNQVDHVLTGELALAYLRREADYIDRDKPDIILLDLDLPGIHGFDVLRTVKADATLCRIPVVVLTSSNAGGDRQQAEEHEPTAS